MTDKGPDLNGHASPLVGRLLTVFGWANAIIVWERLWRNLWPAATVCSIFLSVVFFDVLPLLPYGVHWLVLAGFIGLIAFCFWRAVQQKYIVGDEEIRKRLEAESGLAHRPLTALQDTAVNTSGAGVRNDAASSALWKAHQARALAELAKVKPLAPRPGLAALDMFGARFAVLLVLGIAVISASGEHGSRLSRAFLPVPAQADITQIAFNVWITPPSYTGLAPIYLEGPIDVQKPASGQEETIVSSPTQASLTIPVGSSVLIQVSGADDQPQLQLGNRSMRVERVGVNDNNKDFRTENKIEESDQTATSLKLSAGEDVLGEWPVSVLKDAPPVVAFVEPPKQTRRASLNLNFEARDDFAVKDVWAELVLPDSRTDVDETDQIRFDLTARGFGTKRAQGQGERDYSAHRWAGLLVQVRLYAKDSAGQVGVSDPVDTVLPERVFRHPVARALVEIRKNLNQATPGVVKQSTETLLGLLNGPEHYAHDTIVFLAISVARSRLQNTQSRDAVRSVQDILWETALRLEDGELSIAERELRDVQERLAKAMREDAPSEELERLMDELQQALNTYMQALAEQMERQGLSEMPMNPNSRTMEAMDLQKMVDRARDLARTGSMDAAKRMLSQLNRMLDGLRNGTAQSRQNQEMAKARKMMNELRELAQRQQQLMDQTFRRSQSGESGEQQQQQRQGLQQPRPGQKGQQGAQSEGSPQENAEAIQRQQDALRRELGRLMLQMDEQLGSIPEGLGQAERSMKGAGKALGEGDAAGAVPQQADALEKLRQGMESAAEQMAQRMQGRGPGMGIGMMPGMQRSGQNPGNNRDPFGRQNDNGSYGNFTDDNGIKVPTERDVYRSREIMEELHRRSGDSDRKEPERDYIDRLLRRF